MLSLALSSVVALATCRGRVVPVRSSALDRRCDRGPDSCPGSRPPSARFHGAPSNTGPPCFRSLLSSWGSWLNFFVPPSEYIIGGKDPGVYMNEGIQIAQRGTLVIKDEVVRSVPPPFRDLFFPPRGDPSYYSNRFMGFFLLDPGTGAVVGQFPAPVSGLDRHRVRRQRPERRAMGGRACGPFSGLLAVYFAGARIMGRAAAARGRGTAGRPRRADLVRALPERRDRDAASRVRRPRWRTRGPQFDDDRFFAPVAALLLVLSVFAHLTGVLVVAAVAAAALLAFAGGGRVRLSFWLPLVLGTCLGPSRTWRSTSRRTSPFRSGSSELSGRRRGVARAGGHRCRRARGRRPTRFGRGAHLRVVSMALAVAVLGARGLRLLHPLRGRPAGASTMRTVCALSRRSTSRRTVWRRRSSASPWSRGSLPADAAFLLTVSAVLRLLLLQDPNRPRALLGRAPLSGGHSAGLAPARRRRRVRRRIAGRFSHDRAGPVSALGLERTRPANDPLRAGAGPGPAARLALSRRHAADSPSRGVRGLDPAPGATGRDLRRRRSRAGRVAGLRRTCTCWRSRWPTSTRATCSSSRRRTRTSRRSGEFLTWAAHTLPPGLLRRRRRDRAALARHDGQAGRRRTLPDPRVRVAAERLSSPCQIQGVRSGRLRVPATPGRRGRLRSRCRRRRRPLRPPLPCEGTESPNRFTFRWTRDLSYVSIVGTRPGQRLLTLWMGNGGRPASAGAAQVDLFLNDSALGSVTVGPELDPYRFAIPAELAAAIARSEDAAQLQIVTRTWNPSPISRAAGDDRDLGVMVDRIEIR